MSQTDREVVNRLEFARREYEQQRALVEASLAEQESVRGEMEDLVTYIYGELEATNSEYQAIRTEWEAQEVERLRLEQEAQDLREFLATSTTTTTRPVTTTTRPVGTTTTRPGTTTTTLPARPPRRSLMHRPPSPSRPRRRHSRRQHPGPGCVRSMEPPRSRTRGALHDRGKNPQRNGHAAAEGTPLVAIESGVIASPGWHSEGGLGLYVRTDSGDTWYYAHLSSFASGLIGGLRIEAGQRVGYVGHTGNASTTPHLHIGWQPGGGAYQNPFPVVDGLC